MVACVLCLVLGTSIVSANPSGTGFVSAGQQFSLGQEVESLEEIERYRIGPSDVLRVQVLDMADLTTQATVSEVGTIRLPLIGDVSAAGMTTRELEGALEAAFARYVTDPEVRVEVLQYQSQSYFLYGAVRSVGSSTITGTVTLLEALVSAGGITEEEAAGPIRIIRGAFGREPIEVDGYELFFEGNRAYDIEIEPGDMINVLRKPEYRIYIYDDAGSGGAYDFRDDVTLLQAISLVGGLGQGAKDEVTIVRRVGDGQTEQIKVDFKDILEGKREDVELQPGDVVIIRRGGFFD